MYQAFFLSVILLLISNTAKSADTTDESGKPILTSDEREYLRQRKKLTYCVDPAWMPYEQINEQGQHQGLTSDYVKRLSLLLKVPMELVPTHSWKQSVEYAKSRRCDFLPMAAINREREMYLDFLKSYISYPSVVATTIDKLFIEEMTDVLEHRFAITQGYSAIGKLRAMYPSMDLVEVEGITQGLEMVRNHKVYGFIDSTLSIGYVIQQQGLLDIKISGKTGLSVAPTFAVRNDLPMLGVIMQKGLDAITPDQRQSIYNKWVAVRYDSPTDYRLLGIILIACLISVIVISFWNRRLALANSVARRALDELNLLKLQLEKQNHELEEKNRQLNNFAHTDALTGLSNRAS